MLRHLRFQLTFLYTLVALCLLGLIGFSSYSLLKHYFQEETDLALQYKMAIQYRSYGITPPLALIKAEQEWQATNPHPGVAATSTIQPQPSTLTPTPTPTLTPTLTPSLTPTLTPTFTPTSTPTLTPSPTPQPVISDTRHTGEDNEGDKEDSAPGGSVSTAPPKKVEEEDSAPQIAESAAPPEKVDEEDSAPQIAESVAPPEKVDEEDSATQGSVSAAPPNRIEEEQEPEDNYNAQLASIYVLPLNAKGEIIQNPNQPLPAISQDEGASLAALSAGQDLRTISRPDGTRVRLLTYRTSSSTGPVLLQVGRSLADQDRILKRYVLGWLTLGSATMVFLGLGSWWLSGRSLGPAQRAWDQQQAFISNASHELRTPLTLIKASAEVGLRSLPGDEEKELFEDISGETDYMNHLVDDLLLLSRLDTHRLKLAHESILLPDLVGETAHQAEKLAVEKGIKLEVGDASGMVWGDRMRIRQVLFILLDNAIRFTPPGGLIRLETSEKHKVVQIIVNDTGSGIPAKDLPHVFERFYQANPTGEALARTNGLGLSIAKGIIEAQGGHIHIESRVNQGTRVVIELPAAHESIKS